MQSHARTLSARWAHDFPVYIPMGFFWSQTLALIGFLPAGYAGTGYPLPSLLVVVGQRIRSDVARQRMRQCKSVFVSARSFMVIVPRDPNSRPNVTAHATLVVGWARRTIYKCHFLFLHLCKKNIPFSVYTRVLSIANHYIFA